MAAARKTRRILLVDDNEAFLSALERLLAHFDHEVEAVYSGKEAIAAIPRFDPEIIFLDIGMPEMDGYEVARAIRASGWNRLLVALTGYGQEEDKRRSKEAGFDRHLVKPVEVKDILDVLAGAR